MLIENLMKYENGELNFDESVELFARLIETGLAWTLQGSYGRVARSLIKNGYVDMYGNILVKDQELE
jgi:hypothetical protein